jgi:hypothetical protein
MDSARARRSGRSRRLALAAAVIVGGACLPQAVAARQQALVAGDFTQAAEQGFGDGGANTFARSMQWWKGRLYVGVQREYACTQDAILAKYVPFKRYPPPDPTLSCAPKPQDLPLQGEIWRWTPDDSGGPGTWARVYQSPNIVPIPNTSPQKFTAREMGFRDMTVFVEADGTEALYVSGTSARGFIDGLPPPTLLRSTDGDTFLPVPQDPGTTLGDLGIIENINISSFNRITTHNGKLYVVAGGDFGHGVVYEAANPAGGNDNFVRITPAGVTVTYMASFKGVLYLARGAQPIESSPPYQILKMSTGGPPYSFTTVLTGARLPASLAAGASQSIATMHVVGDGLWIGSNQPAELVRVNPNNTWDLFVGQSRQLADGTWKYPRTGLGDGLDWIFNIHFHRMQAHDGFLYVASNDLSNQFPLRGAPGMEALFGSRFGFDLNRTKDGWYLYPVTFDGFENRDPGGRNNWFNYTGRVAESTPEGLFLGTGNDQFGLQIWRGQTGAASLASPQLLEVERTTAGNVVTWAPSPGAATYHVYRADFGSRFQLGMPSYSASGAYPRPFTFVGSTSEAVFTDTPPASVYQRHYYVVAEDQLGGRSNPSNVGRSPSLLPAVSFRSLLAELSQWQTNNELSSEVGTQLRSQLQSARRFVLLGRHADAAAALQTARGMSTRIPSSWRVTDYQALVTKLIRRADLVRLGKIPILAVI